MPIADYMPHHRPDDPRLLPEGLTPESAYYALDGPREQKISRLESIIAECDLVDSLAARHLAAEAQDYLNEILEEV
jgi:hypothetical protein